jgi:Rrf2 family transcriptional regulator, nitric oxide-sensitive transcriptional repressor
MFKFSEATAIAIHSMIYITNREGKIISLKEIAEKFKISDNHLSKVLQRLVKSGLITSTKGPNGGFSIVSEYKNTTFLEIYEIIEGKIKKHSCLFNSNPNSCQNCIMNDLIDKIDDEFIKYMKNHKISDFSL